MKFIKNGKVISHLAKIYRVETIKELSKYQLYSKSEFENINFENLKIQEIVNQVTRRCFIKI